MFSIRAGHQRTAARAVQTGTSSTRGDHRLVEQRAIAAFTSRVVSCPGVPVDAGMACAVTRREIDYT